MKRVEARRIKLGMSKTELAAELRTTTDALRAWTTGRTVGLGRTREAGRKRDGLNGGWRSERGTAVVRGVRVRPRGAVLNLIHYSAWGPA
jgi:hypothetical protein